MVSTEVVQEEVFSSLYEVHALELGIACGLLITLCFVYDRHDFGLVLLSLLTLTALGYLPTDAFGRGILHMTQKPWYFLLPLVALPSLYSLYTARRAVLPEDTAGLEDPSPVDVDD